MIIKSFKIKDGFDYDFMVRSTKYEVPFPPRLFNPLLPFGY